MSSIEFKLIQGETVEVNSFSSAYGMLDFFGWKQIKPNLFSKGGNKVRVSQPAGGRFVLIYRTKG